MWWLWWRRCVWCSLVYFLWLNHGEWLQDILPSSSSSLSIPPPPDSHIPHRGLIFFYTDTMKETQQQYGERGREASLWLVLLPFPSRLADEDFLCHCQCCALLLPHPPISCQRKETPLISAHRSSFFFFPLPLDQLFCGNECVTGPFLCVSGNVSFCQGRGW